MVLNDPSGHTASSCVQNKSEINGFANVIAMPEQEINPGSQ